MFEDAENGLWTVTLFQKMLNDFTFRARENKYTLHPFNFIKKSRFIVRDFIYDEKKIEESKNAFTKLEMDKKKQFVSIRFILFY